MSPPPTKNISISFKVETNLHNASEVPHDIFLSACPFSTAPTTPAPGPAGSPCRRAFVLATPVAWTTLSRLPHSYLLNSLRLCTNPFLVSRWITCPAPHYLFPHHTLSFSITLSIPDILEICLVFFLYVFVLHRALV